jgi:hypothetical protein
LDALHARVLSRVVDDYQAAHTIAGDIARDLERPISDEEIRAALLALARDGLIQAYVYERKGRRYRPISANEAAALKDPWFMARRTWACRLEGS